MLHYTLQCWSLGQDQAISHWWWSVWTLKIRNHSASFLKPGHANRPGTLVLILIHSWERGRDRRNRITNCVMKLTFLSIKKNPEFKHLKTIQSLENPQKNLVQHLIFKCLEIFLIFSQQTCWPVYRMHGDSPHILLGAKVQDCGWVPVQNLQPAPYAQSVLLSGGLKSFLEQQKFEITYLPA